MIPDWNNLVYRDQWRDGAREPALHQQLPGVHRPHLPRAVRGGLHAEHQRQPGHHQDRSNARSSTAAGTKAGSSRSSPPRRPASASRWSARARPGMACAQQLARAGHAVTRVREDRPHRRPAALRHPRLQDGKAPHRPPHAPDGSRRRRCSAPASKSASTSRCSRCSTTIDAVVLAGGAEAAARPASPGPRAGRHPFRDGLPDPAEQARRRRRRGARRAARHAHAPRASTSS